MIGNKLIKYLLAFVLVFSIQISNTPTYSQSKTKKLKAKEARLKKQLKATQELLTATRKSQKTTLSELRILSRQITYKEELLINLDNQISETSHQIEKNKQQITSLNNELVRLRNEFAEMIRFAYKNRKKENNVMYLFSSDNYSQAYQRMKYIEKYTENRKLKSLEIQSMKQKLDVENEELVLNIESKKNLIVNYNEEKEKFLEVKKNQQVVLKKIQTNKQNLQVKIAKQEKEKEKVAKAIRREIEKQLAKQNKQNSFKLSPEAKLASSSFEKNKGKLPWPVSRGAITKRFGRQRHSQVSSTFIQNNGIDFSTFKGSSVRAVFKGTVTSIFPIAGGGQTVIVSHGAYRTVYSNLKTVSVKLNQKLATKQKIGTLLPNSSGTISEAHFEIWKISGSSLKPQNPSKWFYKK